MTLVKFAPNPGINSDDSTFTAEGRWADGNNVRFVNGKPQVIGGWSNKYTLAAGTACIGLFVHTSTAGAAYIMNGMQDGKLYRRFNAAGTTSDVSPASVTNVKDWSFGAWGAEIVCSIYSTDASGGGLFYQTGTTAAAKITQAPARIVCSVVSPTRRQVLAFGCNEEVSGTFNPLCIRWCDIEDYTDWTSTASNNAGEYILPAAGEIMGAQEVGPYIAVWTNQELFLGEYVGDPGETYRFRRVDKNCGLVGSKLKATLNGVTYWLTTDMRFVRWAPGTAVETIPCPIMADFRDNATDAAGRYIYFAVPVSKFGEIWFFYKDVRDASAVHCSRYLACNVADNLWFRGQMTRSAAVEAGAVALSPYTPSRFGSYLSADALTVHRQESGASADGAALSWSITSADQVLDPNQGVMVRGIVTDIDQQVGDITLTLTLKERPGSTATTKGPFTLAVGATKKDFRASGKYIAVKFGSSGATESYMRLGTPLFDVVPTGSR